MTAVRRAARATTSGERETWRAVSFELTWPAVWRAARISWRANILAADLDWGGSIARGVE